MISVYIQYIYALLRVRSSISRGFLGTHFPGGLFPKVESMFINEGYSVLHPPISGGTVVRLWEDEK